MHTDSSDSGDPSRNLPAVESEASFSEYFAIFRRHFLILTLLVAGAVAGTAVVVNRMDPIYRASAILEITAPEGTVSVEDLLTAEPFQREYFRTLLFRMGMREVMGPVYDDFKLQDQTFEEFVDEFEIEPKRDSNLVEVALEGKNRKRIAAAVNGTVSSFLISVAGDQTETSNTTRKVLDMQADQLRNEIIEERGKLDEFMAENGLLSSIENEQEMLRDQLTEKTRQYEDARNRMAVAQAESSDFLRSQREGLDPGSFPFVASDETYRKLTQQLHAADQVLAELSQDLGEAHPTWLSAKGRRDQIKGQIADRIRSLVEQVQMEFSVRRSVYENLSRDRQELEGKLRELDRRRFVYDRIQRELDRRQTEYESYLRASGQLDPVAEMAGGNVRVREMAMVPTKPVKPRKLLSLVLAALFSLFCGTVLVFVLDAMDDSIRSREDVQARLKVPVIAEVPALKGKAMQPHYRLFEENPDGAVAESFRSMRAALVYSTPGDGCRTILITSAVPSEGKTLCAINLAISFAKIGQRTLLIDADLRRPMAHRVFDLQKLGGLTSVLVHDRDLGEAAADGPVPGLTILPAGPLPPNPAEMLGSEPMLRLLDRVRGEWDRIIIDSPPTCAVTDAVVLAPHVDVVLQVVRSGRSGCRDASRAIRQIKEVGGRHVGVILNGTREMGRSYYRRNGGSDYRRTPEEAAGDGPREQE